MKLKIKLKILVIIQIIAFNIRNIIAIIEEQIIIKVKKIKEIIQRGI
jgi:hypothetical protein